VHEIALLTNPLHIPFSPSLFCHTPLTVHFLQSTIHAFDKMKQFQQTYFDILDVNSRAVIYFYNTSVWFAFRLDWLSLGMLLATALCCIFLDIDASLAGLALVMANGITVISIACLSSISS
jgi:hypothetical protein